MDMYEKEFTADDAKAEIDDVIENGKGYVEQAFNLPYNYFSDESKLIDVDKIIDPEDFEESRIDFFANEEFKKNLEMGLINNFSEENYQKILMLCLKCGLIDGKPRSIKEISDILKIRDHLVRDGINQIICNIQRRSFTHLEKENVPCGRSFTNYVFNCFHMITSGLSGDEKKELLWFDIPKNPKFKNYGEFLEDYIVHEDNIEVADNLNQIFLDYARAHGTSRKASYREF